MACCRELYQVSRASPLETVDMLASVIYSLVQPMDINR